VNPLRRGLELISRHVTLKKRLPADLGGVPMIASPAASLTFWKPGLESDLFDFAREFVQPGYRVWDIGANVGLFSVAGARLAGSSGEVIAIEPDAWLIRLLQKSAALQPATSASIRILPAAVDKQAGIARLNIAKRSRASNYLSSSPGNSQAGGVREQIDVLTVTLDWLMATMGAPQVVKIDVEGAEFDALSGAKQVLRMARPVILCEVAERSADAVTELLVAHGYAMENWETRQPVTRATFNTLARPAG
jgi:FkbM family methyltransferase